MGRFLKILLGLVFILLLFACGGGEGGNGSGSDQSGVTVPLSTEEKSDQTVEISKQLACSENGRNVFYSLVQEGDNLVSIRGEDPNSVATVMADVVVQCDDSTKAFIFTESAVSVQSLSGGEKRLARSLAGVAVANQDLPENLEELLALYNQNPVGAVDHFYTSDSINNQQLTAFVEEVLNQGVPPRFTSYPEATGELGWGVTETLAMTVRGADSEVTWYLNGVGIGTGLVLDISADNLLVGDNRIIVEVRNAFGSTIYTMERYLHPEPFNSPPQIVNLQPGSSFDIHEHDSTGVSWRCLDNETLPENLLYTLSVNGNQVLSMDGSDLVQGDLFALDVDALGLQGSNSLIVGCTDDGTDNYGGSSSPQSTSQFLSFEVLLVDDKPLDVVASFETPIYVGVDPPLIGRCDVDDPDGFSELLADWYVNDNWIDDGLSYPNSGWLRKGMKVGLKCTADGVSDLFEAVVRNSIPQVLYLRILPEVVDPETQPLASYTFYDRDSDPDRSLIRWYVNEVYLGSVIHPDDFQAGDLISLEVVPFDGESYGMTRSTRIFVTAEPNGLPIADAGQDGSVGEQDILLLDGSGSHDPDGDPLTYSWSVVSTPPGVTAVQYTLSDVESVSPTFSAEVVGDYVLQLIVNDGTDDSIPDQIVINVCGHGMCWF